MPPKRFVFGKKKRGSKPRGKAALQPEQNEQELAQECELESAEMECGPGENAPEAESDNDLSTAEDAANTSTTETKRGHYSSICENTSSTVDGDYEIIHSSFLHSLLSFLSCPVCHLGDLTYTASDRQGLATKFDVDCSTCMKTIWSQWSSPVYATRKYDINPRTAIACRETGMSHANISSFCGLMALPKPLHHKSYQDVSTEIHHATVEAAERVMLQAADVVKARSNDTSEGVPVTTVSFDGTWQKRGHSSHYGVGVAIDFGTGLVLDAQVISNFCLACERGPKRESEGYGAWYARHQWQCQKNFDGSSNAMEAEAAGIIFSRSIRTRGLKYGTMLCDGDSKGFIKAKESCGYEVEKEDCINHIAKRMFNALENLKKSNKSLNYKLTRPNIEKITNTYATNLKQAAPDPENMKKAVMAGYFHMISTDAQPNHTLCPDGSTSWCHYKRAIANNTTMQTHRPTINRDIRKLVFPIFKRLSDVELLKRCARMGTQNANESFNAQIWKRCPKNNFAKKAAIETATCLAIIGFNCGPAGLKCLFLQLGLPWMPRNADYALNRQQQQIAQSKTKSTRLSKWKRKALKSRRLAMEHEHETREGPTYASGGFNS